ncbi:MAG: hypothetical protein P0Y53_00575 [Candidatus Pseudobacter hemicellulosilyticus]|uniref:Uncharacterized protein n=1 Tax=Candidatus Pseudobacter hemicellulosilyticus TaxID=3121375 RepID=A0AAJ5WRG6_9BACT|nr:MAG: hypothetical protein P0Y53_00575 [Pseudobacter sp.]
MAKIFFAGQSTTAVQKLKLLIINLLQLTKRTGINIAFVANRYRVEQHIIKEHQQYLYSLLPLVRPKSFFITRYSRTAAADFAAFYNLYPGKSRLYIFSPFISTAIFSFASPSPSPIFYIFHLFLPFFHVFSDKFLTKISLGGHTMFCPKPLPIKAFNFSQGVSPSGKGPFFDF